jgi:hypothetical protein
MRVMAVCELDRVSAAFVLLFLALPVNAAAQDRELDDIFGARVRQQAEGALAVLGMTALPSETASALVLDSGRDGEEQYDFRQGQLGGGFRVSEAFPLWLEGYIGWNRYDPDVVLQGDDGQERLPLKWTSIAATGGIGWAFDLNDEWTFRPQAHLSLGRVQSDASIGAQVIANRLGLDAEFLEGGGVTAGGYGASATLAYNHRWDNDWEADLTLRHTHLRFEPIGQDKELIAEAEAVTTALWSRLRVPTGLELFDRPVRTVYEFTAARLHGDQGEILDTDWLAGLGFGGEIDLERTWVPWVTTTRLMVRYTRGDALEGVSVGFAASF